MNIFALDQDPNTAARYMVDSHVVKMILESAQLLSTAHRVLDGEEYVLIQNARKIKRWRLPDAREQVLYSATHVNHPSAVWARETDGNYEWLYFHFLALLQEYTFRYGKKHKCEELKIPLSGVPYDIPIGDRTDFALAMPLEYWHEGGSVDSYRNYYIVAKAHLHKWTKREKPEWLTNGLG